MEVESLSTYFNKFISTRIVSLNMTSTKTSWLGHNKHLPLPHGLLALPSLWRIAREATINHLFASPAEPVLTSLLARLDNTILTLCKDSPEISRLEEKLGTLSRMQRVVVESERHRELLLQGGIAEKRLRLIYPGIGTKPYRPAPEPFTIMFATSPKKKNDFLSRGIQLMLRAAKRLPHVRFRFIWRERQHEKLQALIRDIGVNNIQVINGYVPNMEEMYDSAHAVILPALTSASLKPCPHSGLHSLAHGKPVLTSQYVSLSKIVERNKCGVVFEPTVDALCDAIWQLQDNYEKYQRNAHSTIERKFSDGGFIERYEEVYSSLIDIEKLTRSA